MKFNLYFSEKIYLKASRLSLSDYENSKTYDIMNRAQNQGGDNLLSYYRDFMSIITQLITLSSYIFILIGFRVWLVIVIMIIPILLYILDEPNASIDSITEKEISNLYENILENKIGIIIAHRFLNIVDKIIVLQNGEIVEFGKHKELIKKGKIYKQLTKL